MLEGKETSLYAAFQAKDARFDGCFFVGVRSTGIYCRPVCTARLPKPENCSYFETAAEAEKAGFRPCLQCRPELAPGRGPVENQLGPLGIIRTRARTIRALAEVFVNKRICFDVCVHPEAEMEKLTQLPGIGPWTANYIAMRVLAWTDAFPDTDLGVKKALAPRSGTEIRKLAERWRPWRAYGVMCLWTGPQECEED